MQIDILLIKRPGTKNGSGYFKSTYTNTVNALKNNNDLL